MSDPDPSATRRATWLIWAGAAACALTLLVVSSWWWLPRNLPGLASAIGTTIPPLTKPLAERCYTIGADFYMAAVSTSDQPFRQANLHKANAYLRVSRDCYGALSDRQPDDRDLAQRLLRAHQLYYATRKMLVP